MALLLHRPWVTGIYFWRNLSRTWSPQVQMHEEDSLLKRMLIPESVCESFWTARENSPYGLPAGTGEWGGTGKGGWGLKERSGMLTAQDLLSSFTGLPHNTDYHLDVQKGPEKQKPRIPCLVFSFRFCGTFIQPHCSLLYTYSRL